MSQRVDSDIKSFVAGGAIGANIRVILTAGKLAVAAAGTTDYDKELGTTLQASFADGDVIPVLLRSARGTRKCVCYSTLAAGVPVYGAANGYVDDASSGTQLGVSLEACTTTLDVIEVLYI